MYFYEGEIYLTIYTFSSAQKPGPTDNTEAGSWQHRHLSQVVGGARSGQEWHHRTHMEVSTYNTSNVHINYISSVCLVLYPTTGILFCVENDSIQQGENMKSLFSQTCWHNHFFYHQIPVWAMVGSRYRWRVTRAHSSGRVGPLGCDFRWPGGVL